jgi:putative DNA primase/helicase
MSKENDTPDDPRVVDFATKAPRPKKTRHIPDPNDPRPTIRLAHGEIGRICREAKAALVKANLGLYQRDGRIVSVVEEPAKASDGSTIMVQRIKEVGDYALLHDLDSAARFTKWDARSNALVVADPPLSIVLTLQQKEIDPPFPILAGVINAPTLRANGSVLDEPGYDEATGLLFDPRGAEFPPIPWKPRREQALAALAELKDVIKDFPFVTEVDRSVALSAMLTPIVRRSLPSAPMQAFSATIAGSGKSKLVDIASVLATGERAPVDEAKEDKEAFSKTLGALLLCGASIIALDNIEAPLGGALLCQILTQERARPRILGKSESPPTSTGANVLATGNGLVLVGDVIRRSLLCSLDPKSEYPELRTFDREPVAYVKQNRPALVAAALTILRAYVCAGRPARPTPLGSFEEWSDLVRGSLIWLDCADPVDSQKTLRKSDPVRSNLATVMAQWKAIVGFDRVTVAQVISRAIEMQGGVFVHPELRDALLRVAGQGGELNSRMLGNWLSLHKGRIVAGLRFDQLEPRQGVATWQLTEPKEN